LTGGYTTYYETGQIKEEGQAKDLPKNKYISFYSDLVPPTIEQDNGQMFRLPEKNIEIENPPVSKELKNTTKEGAQLNTGQRSENKYISNSFQEVEIQTKTQIADLPLQNNYRPTKVQKDRVIKENSVSFADEPSSPEVNLNSNSQTNRYQKNDLPADRVIRNNGNGDILPDNSGNTKIKKYYPNGKLYAELPYLNGVVDGKAKFYFENERLKAITARKGWLRLISPTAG
jgi:antitoxin component YwqK of YwqJK toxin-antitoxin module